MTKQFLGTTSGAAMILLAMSGASFADVTAEEVWQNWQDISAASGQMLSAAGTDRSGGTLTLTDMSIVVTSPEGDVTGVVPMVVFRETGDGRVEVTMSENYSMNMNMTSPGGETSSNAIYVKQSGLVLTASGDPQAITYDMKADSFIMDVTDFVVGDKPNDIAIDVTLTDMTAGYLVEKAAMIQVTSNFTADSLQFGFAGTDTDNGSSFDAYGEMMGVAGYSNSAMSESTSAMDFAAMLAAGFTTDFAFTYDEGGSSITVVDENKSTTEIVTSSTGGKFGLAMDSAQIVYGLEGKGVNVSVKGTSIPFPEVEAAYDEASFDLRMPLSKQDEPQDFTLNTRLKGLTVSDFLWSMFDPGASIPRDPATLIIETSGKIKPLVNMLDEKEIEAAVMAGAPAEIHAFNIDKVQVTVAGAELLADGALTFDNTQPPMLGGVAPMPTGKVNLSLTGVNGLLGKLQGIGLVQPDMVMGFGMFAGMLAKPGPTPDSLTSVIEIQEGGRILANGNPLPF
jgi:hypothetical protein